MHIRDEALHELITRFGARFAEPPFEIVLFVSWRSAPP